MRAFVTGGNGFLGQGITAALLDAGYKVRSQVRGNIKPIFGEDRGVQRFTTNEMLTGRFAQGMQDCDIVFNLVGIIREFPGRDVTFDKAHPEFTRLLIKACKDAGVKRYIHMSVLAVDSGLKIKYNTSKLESEAMVRESGLDWTIVRPSLIFGPGDRFAVEFAGWMKRGVPIPLIDKGDYRLTPVSRNDVCRGMVKIIDNEATVGKIYEIGGPAVHTYLEILQVIETAAGRKARLLKIPAPIIIAAAKIFGRFAWFPATADMMKQLISESVTKDSEFWEVTGIEPKRLADELDDYIQ